MSKITQLDQHRKPNYQRQPNWRAIPEMRSSLDVLTAAHQSQEQQEINLANLLHYETGQALTLSVTVTDPLLAQAALLSMKGPESLIPGMDIQAIAPQHAKEET